MARIAESLAVLRSEFDALAPQRKKTRDGWIGDDAHAGRASRHNPNYEGVVCALDITDDVAGGCPVHVIASALVARLQAGGETNPDFEYVISNRFVASRKSGWQWLPYTGADPHDLHVHFAVGRGPDSAPAFPYDDTTPWNIANNVQEDTMTQEQFDGLVAEFRSGVKDLAVAVGRAADNTVVTLKSAIKEIAKAQGVEFDEAALEQAIKAGVNASFAEAFKAKA